jgi:hypothetical protein
MQPAIVAADVTEGCGLLRNSAANCRLMNTIINCDLLMVQNNYF